MQPGEDLNNLKLGQLLVLGWVVVYSCYEYWSNFVLIYAYIIQL